MLCVSSVVREISRATERILVEDSGCVWIHILLSVGVVGTARSNRVGRWPMSVAAYPGSSKSGRMESPARRQYRAFRRFSRFDNLLSGRESGGMPLAAPDALLAPTTTSIDGALANWRTRAVITSHECVISHCDGVSSTTLRALGAQIPALHSASCLGKKATGWWGQ